MEIVKGSSDCLDNLYVEEISLIYSIGIIRTKCVEFKFSMEFNEHGIQHIFCPDDFLNSKFRINIRGFPFLLISYYHGRCHSVECFIRIHNSNVMHLYGSMMASIKAASIKAGN